MPLGLLPGMDYEERSFQFEPGDCALLHSDGLAEAHAPDREMFGFLRVAELVGKGSSAEALIDLCLAELGRSPGPTTNKKTTSPSSHCNAPRQRDDRRARVRRAKTVAQRTVSPTPGRPAARQDHRWRQRLHGSQAPHPFMRQMSGLTSGLSGECPGGIPLERTLCRRPLRCRRARLNSTRLVTSPGSTRLPGVTVRSGLCVTGADQGMSPVPIRLGSMRRAAG